jgi:uncharacterized protein
MKKIKASNSENYTLEFNNQPQPDTDELLALASMRMPFGKYRGRLLIDLPEPYVVWFANNGFPEGKLGRMLQAVYEIKVNGLEYLFIPLRRIPRPRGSQ